MTIDTMFLVRAMRTPAERDFGGVDLDKWVAAAMSNPERRARGMAYCDALMGQLPTAEDFERVPVEREKAAAPPIRHIPQSVCACESGKVFADCHGADAEE